jgi:hypothetical protein
MTRSRRREQLLWRQPRSASMRSSTSLPSADHGRPACLGYRLAIVLFSIWGTPSVLACREGPSSEALPCRHAIARSGRSLAAPTSTSPGRRNLRIRKDNPRRTYRHPVGGAACGDRQSLPRTILDQAALVRGGCAPLQRRSVLGDRMAVQHRPNPPRRSRRSPGMAGSAKGRRHAPGRPANRCPPSATATTVERQHRTAAVDGSHRSRTHRAMGLEHPRQSRNART